MSAVTLLEPIAWESLSSQEQQAALLRDPQAVADETASRVKTICDDVSARGDRALAELTERFDRVRLDDLAVSKADRVRAWEELDPRDRECLSRAARNITTFHEAQRLDDIAVTTEAGVQCRKLRRPIERVGLYVPGGTAPLVSTLLMLAIPARIAGCRERIVCTPPGPSGAVAPSVLAAAELCGVTSVFSVGGAQAVAAMASGTESIPRVDKIFGPGNAYVTAAKSYVSSQPGGPAIDLPAGPSEVLVIADDDASPRFVAADLLSQAEHDPAARVVLVALSVELVEKVGAELDRQLPSLSRRSVAMAALEKARGFVVQSLDAAVALSNAYAPEHLLLNCRDAEALVDDIEHAGSVFVGPWSSEAFGDYASGTNHVLPTAGAARAYSGLSLDAFEKTISVQTIQPEGVSGLGPTVERLAALEGLDAHAAAVAIRRATLDAGKPQQ